MEPSFWDTSVLEWLLSAATIIVMTAAVLLFISPQGGYSPRGYFIFIAIFGAIAILPSLAFWALADGIIWVSQSSPYVQKTAIAAVALLVFAGIAYAVARIMNRFDKKHDIKTDKNPSN